MTVRQMVENAVSKRFQNKSFNATDVQKVAGDKTTFLHISQVRTVLGAMVKDGKLTVEGKGKGRKYVCGTVTVPVEEPKPAKEKAKPKSKIQKVAAVVEEKAPETDDAAALVEQIIAAEMNTDANVVA